MSAEENISKFNNQDVREYVNTMIVKSYEINKKTKDISSINTFLLYGENIGLKKDIRELIINTKNKKDEKAEFISFYENDITRDEKRFYSSVYSGSLFSLFFT